MIEIDYKHKYIYIDNAKIFLINWTHWFNKYNKTCSLQKIRTQESLKQTEIETYD